ncbi:hypothetical protein CCHR01_04066 [Colletotrichum chrysophilum]|uniref:Uncharacterized protein n=1 Tax=Colletotrichum chrysophilum TaxID=1836956 RepID=A0AAD9AV83_9PEZI|nr:hypothetical protein CCHR01_04066 [Colletotrichum chrysophilum]
MGKNRHTSASAWRSGPEEKEAEGNGRVPRPRLDPLSRVIGDWQAYSAWTQCTSHVSLQVLPFPRTTCPTAGTKIHYNKWANERAGKVRYLPSSRRKAASAAGSTDEVDWRQSGIRQEGMKDGTMYDTSGLVPMPWYTAQPDNQKPLMSAHYQIEKETKGPGRSLAGAACTYACFDSSHDIESPWPVHLSVSASSLLLISLSIEAP